MARTPIPTVESVSELSEGDSVKEYLKAVNRRDALASQVKANEDAISALKKRVAQALK